MMLIHLPHWVRSSDRPRRIIVGVPDDLKMKLRELDELGFALEAYDDRDGGLQFCISHNDSDTVLQALVPPADPAEFIRAVLTGLDVKLLVDRVTERQACQTEQTTAHASDSIATSGASERSSSATAKTVFGAGARRAPGRAPKTR